MTGKALISTPINACNTPSHASAHTSQHAQEKNGVAYTSFVYVIPSTVTSLTWVMGTMCQEHCAHIEPAFPVALSRVGIQLEARCF